MCSLKVSQKLFMQSLSLLISLLFFMLLNGYILGIEKPDEVCSLTFVIDGFSGLPLHPLILSIKHSTYAQIIKGVLSDFGLHETF